MNDNPNIEEYDHMLYTLYLHNSHFSEIRWQLHLIEICSADNLSSYIKRKRNPLFSPSSIEQQKLTLKHQRISKFLYQTTESLITLFSMMQTRNRAQACNANHSPHLPFRNSKLTHLIKDCFTANYHKIDGNHTSNSITTANVILFLTLFTQSSKINETLKTLKFGRKIYRTIKHSHSNSKRFKKNAYAKLRIANNHSIQQMRDYTNEYEHEMMDSTTVTSEIPSSSLLSSVNELGCNPKTREGRIIDQPSMVEILSQVRNILLSDMKFQTGICPIVNDLNDCIFSIEKNDKNNKEMNEEVKRLQFETELLRNQISTQNSMIMNFEATAIKSSATKKKKTVENLNKKLDGIEWRLQEHTCKLKALENECQNSCCNNSNRNTSILSNNDFKRPMSSKSMIVTNNTRKIASKMQKKKFLYSPSTITDTTIISCELEKALENRKKFDCDFSFLL